MWCPLQTSGAFLQGFFFKSWLRHNVPTRCTLSSNSWVETQLKARWALCLSGLYPMLRLNVYLVGISSLNQALTISRTSSVSLMQADTLKECLACVVLVRSIELHPSYVFSSDQAQAQFMCMPVTTQAIDDTSHRSFYFTQHQTQEHIRLDPYNTLALSINKLDFQELSSNKQTKEGGKKNVGRGRERDVIWEPNTRNKPKGFVKVALVEMFSSFCVLLFTKKKKGKERKRKTINERISLIAPIERFMPPERVQRQVRQCQDQTWRSSRRQARW